MNLRVSTSVLAMSMVLASFSSPSIAQRSDSESYNGACAAIFDYHDTNDTGRLSRQEWTTMQNGSEAGFDSTDTNNDGLVSEGEFCGSGN